MGAHGRLPTTMHGVAWRQKEIQYASRMDQHGTLRRYQSCLGCLLHSPECAGIHGLLHGWAEKCWAVACAISITPSPIVILAKKLVSVMPKSGRLDQAPSREMGYVDMLEKA